MFKAVAASFLIATTAAASDFTKVKLNEMREVKTITLKNINQDRVLLLLESINKKTTDPLISQIKAFAKNTPREPIYLVIDSNGGGVESGMKLVNTIRGAKAVRGLQTTCVVTGRALSMAAILMSYCHKTYLMPNSFIMFHEAGYGVEGSASDIKRTVDFTEKFLAGIEKNLAKQLGITYLEYVEFRREEQWIPADEAVEMGFADALIDNFYYEVEPEKDNPFTLFFGQFLKGLTNGKAK